jgi:(E)-4-hydroxy-3-methylbut-2-enyl-diphosphate synthase
MHDRLKTTKVKIKDFYIGSNAPILVQSMTNYPLENVSATIEQINLMHKKGAGLVRVAVRTRDEIKYLNDILKNVSIPVCADIHFDYKIALGAIDAGINKIRINPGNIGDEKRVKDVVSAAKNASIPIRIGVNGGSIDKKKYQEVTPLALLESALDHIHILEDLNFDQIVVSIKSSDLRQTIEANQLLRTKVNYPIHIGLTEAGYGQACVVNSSIAIGSLLLDGIGDTIRVSMTGDPVEEIDVAYDILKAINAIDWGVKIISCPTCGRTDPTIDLLEIAKKIDEDLKRKYLIKLQKIHKIITIAIMGCEVNGPGEAAHADLGIAGARNGKFLLFAKGEIVKKINESEIISSIGEQVEQLLEV